MKTLADLDITPKYRKDVILKLKAIGPKGDCPWQADAAA